QLQVVGAEQVPELAPAGLQQVVGRQVAGGVHLDAAHAEALRLLQRPPQRQPERLQAKTDLQATHGRRSFQTARLISQAHCTARRGPGVRGGWADTRRASYRGACVRCSGAFPTAFAVLQPRGTMSPLLRGALLAACLV